MSYTFLLCLLTWKLWVPTASASVEAGRAALSRNNANPTRGDILHANQEFQATAGKPVDPRYQEANAFHAVTRLLVFAMGNKDNTVMDTLAELASALGMELLSSSTPLSDGPPFSEPPEIYDHYDPPASMPNGEEIRAFLAGPLVDELDGALANLAVIDSTFSIHLLPVETGNLVNIEVDYGDVLFFRAILHTIKAYLRILTAYGLDMDTRSVAAAANAGMLQLQRDLLDRYAGLLALRGNGTGAASLADARQSLMKAIAAYRDALTFIAAETHGQAEELFFFSSADDMSDASALATHLETLETSLASNTAATFLLERKEVWSVNIGQNQDTLNLGFNVNGTFEYGHVRGYGEIYDYAVDGSNVSFRVHTLGWACGNWWQYGLAVARGTFTDVTKATIEGTFDITSVCPNTAPLAFTAIKTLEERDEATMDFNYLFGNTSKPPLNIKAVLPDFDQDGEIIAGTFRGSPVLGSLFPGVVTEDDIIRKLEWDDFVYPLPVLTPTLDGIPTEWTGITPVIRDDTDDNAPAHGNIDSMYVARDTEFLYWMLELADPPPAQGLLYNADFSTSSFNPWGAPVYYSHAGLDADGNPTYALHFHYQWPAPQIISNNVADVGIGSVVEARVPLHLFQHATKLQARAWTWSQEVVTQDATDSVILQLPTGSVGGSVTCEAWQAGRGQIFVSARSGPDPVYSSFLGSAILSSPGNYEIAGLPLGREIYLFVRWDADGNGVPTFGDYIGKNDSPVTVSDVKAHVALNANILVDDRFVMSKPGLFRVFGSNTFNHDAFWQSSFTGNNFWRDLGTWTFLGEGDWTRVLHADTYYKTILILWHSNTLFHFDAFEDLTSGTAFAADASGKPAGYRWVSRNLRNFDSPFRWGEPSYFKGHADLRYVTNGDWYGYSIFDMPDDPLSPGTPRELKIHVVSNSFGDLNNDNLTDMTDALMGMQLLSGQSPGMVMVPMISDINGNGRIGQEEINYILHYLAGMREKKR